jgi:hypothetical protein
MVEPTDPPNATDPTKKQRFSTSKAWTAKLAGTGFVAVVRGFLDNYSILKPYPLTSGEALFIIHLMRFKWGEEAPFPTYKTLASLMGISTKMARRHAQSLQQKKYLIREIRKGSPNKFDLHPLFEALESHLDKPSRIRRNKRPSMETGPQPQDHDDNPSPPAA